MKLLRLLSFILIAFFSFPLLHSAPVITNVSPNFGPDTGGSVVTIIGSGFTGATAVDFGPNAATTFTVDSDTQITATTPAYVPIIVDVTVTTPSGTNPITFMSKFVYQGPILSIVGNRTSNNVSIVNLDTNTDINTLGPITAPRDIAIT